MSSTLRYNARLLEQLKEKNDACRLAKQRDKNKQQITECAPCALQQQKQQQIKKISGEENEIAWWDNQSVTLDDLYGISQYKEETTAELPQQQTEPQQQQQQQKLAPSVFEQVMSETVNELSQK